MERLKVRIFRYWPLRMLTLLALRPKRFLEEFVYSLSDYRRFRESVRDFRSYLNQVGVPTAEQNRPGLLIVAGRAMNAQWCQVWAILGAVCKQRGFKVYTLTSKSQPIQNLYFKLFRFHLIYLEDLEIASVPVPEDITQSFASLVTFQDVKEFELDGIPLGKMALSTYSRQRATGIMDIGDPAARREVWTWLAYLYKTLVVGERLYAKYGIEMLYFTEVFMEEYGALYYSALKMRLTIVRFAGTVRDNAIVVQHLNRESDRTHFSSLSRQSWSQISKWSDLSSVERDLHRNFMDRYGDRWALSKRNQPNTRIVPVTEAKEMLCIPEGRKVAVIYSHILYDTLFFNGEDLYPSYADWLVETIRAACLNPEVQWFVKVHPSNLWRGELEYFNAGKYEELRLIEEHIGPLPDHVRLVYPDTPLSPYTWLQLADCGVTVRGTSGIELAALGKPVITAGTGRYEEAGISINPRTVGEYEALLANVQNIQPPSKEQMRLGKLFAYATFCMKPFTLDFLRPVPRTGKSKIFSTDDLVYLADFQADLQAIPDSIARFTVWSRDRNSIDFLSCWPSSGPDPESHVLKERAG
jgi:hypothetical protein